MDIPDFDGWTLLGAFPDGAPNDVGSWLLVHGDEACLLEVPPGVTVPIVKAALQKAKAMLRFVTASHIHEDHLDWDAWAALEKGFPKAKFIDPSTLCGDMVLDLAGEPLWLLHGPKHSEADLVTVFRGVAMTGDIELGTLASVNKEVPVKTKRRSMNWLRDFTRRANYSVHSAVSAHLNSVRLGINWRALFTYE